MLLDELILLTPERCQFIQDHIPLFYGGGISDHFASIFTHLVCVALVILFTQLAFFFFLIFFVLFCKFKVVLTYLRSDDLNHD